MNNVRFKQKAQLLVVRVITLAVSLVFTGCPNVAGGKPTGGGTTPPTPQTYAITFGVDGTGGTLKAKADGITETATSPITVEKGKTVTFTATADAGYRVKGWTLDGTAVNGTNNSYSLSVGKAVTVKVSFESNSTPLPVHTVTFAVDGTGGTLKAKADGITETATSPVTVEQGKTVTFTATPDANFAVDKWTITGGSFEEGTGAEASLTAQLKVTAEADIKVKFKYTGAALQVNQQNFTGTVGDTLPVYKLVQAGSGDYTATPENAACISVDLNNATGNVTVRCLAQGNSRIRVRDNKSGEEKYSGTVTVNPLLTIPDEFTADGIKYKVVDKPNKYVHIEDKADGYFSGTVAIAATVTYNSETYKITGCTRTCLMWNFGGVSGFTVDSSNEFLCAENGVLFTKDKTRLIKYPKKKTDTSYTVPNGVRTIGAYAFYNIDENLAALQLPESLTTVEDNGISECTQLANINLPAALTSLGKSFLFISKITEAVIPEGVTRLHHGSLAWCSELTAVTLPASFQGSSSAILYKCPQLTEVTCKATTPPSVIGFDYGTPIASCTLKVPASSVSDYQAAPIWKDFGMIQGF